MGGYYLASEKKQEESQVSKVCVFVCVRVCMCVGGGGVSLRPPPSPCVYQLCFLTITHRPSEWSLDKGPMGLVWVLIQGSGFRVQVFVIIFFSRMRAVLRMPAASRMRRLSAVCQPHFALASFSYYIFFVLIPDPNTEP